jgi:hypothetical protein
MLKGDPNALMGGQNAILKRELNVLQMGGSKWYAEREPGAFLGWGLQA